MSDLASSPDPQPGPATIAFSTHRLARLSILAGATLAAVAMGVTLREIDQQARDQDWVAHTLEAREQISQLMNSIRSAGAGLRLYATTHDPANLARYQRAREEIPRRTAELRRLTSDNPVQTRALDALQPLVDARMASLANYVKGQEATVSWLESSQHNMEAIDQVIQGMDGEEGRLLSLRRDAAAGAELWVKAIASTGLAVSLVLLMLGVWLERTGNRHDTQLVRLLQIGAEVSNSSANFREALQGCLDEICKATGWTAGHANLLEGADLVSAGIWHGPSGPSFEAVKTAVGNLRFGAGSGLSGRVMVTRTPAWMGAASMIPLEPDQQRAFEALKTVGLNHVIALPVLAGDRVPAVLQFFMHRFTRPEPALLQVCTSLGVQLGRVWEREQARLAADRHAREIADLSIHDELTGLYNRRGFLTLGNQQLKLSVRNKERCLLLFMDMDGLKRINDQLGHTAGDDALTQIATALRQTLREPDIVARLGGDEFVALIPAARPEATGVEDRIQASLRGKVAAEDPAYPLRISVGCSWVDPAPEARLEILLETADQAMYERKRQRKLEAGSVSELRH